MRARSWLVSAAHIVIEMLDTELAPETLDDAAVAAPRKPKAAPPTPAEAVAAAIAADGGELESLPPPAPPVVNGAPTHAFAYPPTGKLMLCPCGAEQDVVLREGNCVRLYRPDATAMWMTTIAACPKNVPPPPQVPKAETKEPVRGVAKAFMEALRSSNPGLFQPEIINGCDVDKAANDVDLSNAFSPVLRSVRDNVFPQSDERADAMRPLDATPLEGDRYRVYFSDGPRDVDAATLRVMRARYILTRAEVTRALYQMDARARATWAKLYNITWLPPADSPLGNQILNGGVITIPREGDKPVDFLAVMRVLSTPGGEVPSVCPVLTEEEGA